MFGTEHKWTTK